MESAPDLPNDRSTAAAIVRERRETIKERWLRAVREELASARDQSDPVLQDNVPAILDSLAHVIEQGQVDSGARELFASHADNRIQWSSYSVEKIVREYAILRNTLFSVIEERHAMSPSTRDLILEFMDQAVQRAGARFTEVQRFHQRLEMQYLKLVEHLVAETGNAENLEDDGLGRLLEVILHGLEAEAAAFLLYRAETLELSLSSASAKSKQLAELYRAALSLCGVTAPSQDRDPAVRLLKVRELEGPPRDALRELGIGFLVIVDTRARGRFPGSLCIGFREERSFDPVELHLLERLGDRLALILATLELQQQSKAALDRARRENALIDAERSSLEQERKRRDDLIVAISHDMKNPLNTAKLGAELIRRGPADRNTNERLADKILRSISRSDKMIQDLLEAQRIRAGKRLPLKIEPYRMNDLVHEVVGDMRDAHGDRFVVIAEEPVDGFWSWDGMRRVLENLLGNAVKYGDPEIPITIRIRNEDGLMVLSVHNRGQPLSPDEQAKVFDPFERGKHPHHVAKKGWGIGLTLVHGIVAAHGGNVTVESSADGGTIFTVRNPMDSRPYQNHD